MKKPLTILLITLLTILVIYACGSTIRTADTSFVTITFGEDAHTARLKAEKATILARARYLLADLKLMPEAYAYIPSVVQVLVVTVSAADITTPIVGIDSIKPDQTASTIRIEVPNGSARQFTVEGIRGVDSQTYYRGTATADLSGLDVALDVSMAFVGPGIIVDTLHSQATDTTGCGTAALPCKTITYALNSRTTGTDAIIVSAGTYTAGESYPLQLKPGTALICTGTGYSTVIDSDSAGSDAIYGNDGASVDNCKILPGCDATGISDSIGGTFPAIMKINNVFMDEASPGCGPLDGIILSADSLVLETIVQNTTWHGINILGGRPEIRNNIFMLNPTGIEFSSGAGDALVTANTFSSNQTGISISAVAKPTISGNLFAQQFTWNGTGIAINSGNPRITGNTIQDHNIGISILDASPDVTSNTITANWIGIDITTAVGAPKVNENAIFCNAAHDVGVNDPLGLLVFDLRNNAWDHDATTSPTGTPPGPTVFAGSFSNLVGDDIFVTTPTPTPNYIPFNMAVPNGCLPPQGVGKPGK